MLLAAPVIVIGCSNDDANSVAPPANAAVSILDQCDSASFNAGLGAGTCARAGSTTLAAFNAELNATGRVAAWTFDPTSLTLRVGQAITATNNGGEDHTFTEVQQFGGGIVPALNAASGNATEAPECADITAADHIKPGASMTTDAETTVGTHLYQCCIHPWMRETVTVTGS
jgi:plastocyanin